MAIYDFKDYDTKTLTKAMEHILALEELGFDVVDEDCWRELTRELEMREVGVNGKY
jgi:hypothetical protein